MTIRIVYRPSFRRSPRIQTLAIAESQPALVQTLRSAFQEEEPAETAAPTNRWTQGQVESLILILVRLASVAVALAVWRIGSDLGLFWNFVFNGGVLSHWQVWFALGVLLSGSALALSRRMQIVQAHEASAQRAQAA